MQFKIILKVIFYNDWTATLYCVICILAVESNVSSGLLDDAETDIDFVSKYRIQFSASRQISLPLMCQRSDQKNVFAERKKRERETFYANGWSKNLANLHKMSSSQISIIKQLIRDPFCRLEISHRRHFCRSPSSAAKIKLIFCTPLNDIFSGRTCETNKQDKKWSSRSKLFLQKSEKLEN